MGNETTSRAKYSQAEITRLVRVARSLNSFHIKQHERQFTCPVHYEAKVKCGDRGLAHRFTVLVLPWEDPTRVVAVRKALISHLKDAEANGEPCDDPDLLQ